MLLMLLTDENWTWVVRTCDITCLDVGAVVQSYVDASLQLSQKRPQWHTQFDALLKLQHALLWVQFANVGYALVTARGMSARSFCLKQICVRNFEMRIEC
jgi:hypothetical protein